MTRRQPFWRSAFLLIPLLGSGPSYGQGSAQPSLPGRAPDQVFTLGADGWVLERFGRDLAILRTDVAPASGAAGLLVMSCESNEQRWRLSFPRPIPMDTSRSGDILLRPYGSPGRRNVALLGRVRITDGRVLTLAETRSSGSGFVPTFVRLLKSGPARFDLLLRATGSSNPHRLFEPALPAVVFAPTVRRTDLIAFDDFLSTCDVAPKR